jgi:two-component system, NtrC family, sensor histidine kinase PilS
MPLRPGERLLINGFICGNLRAYLRNLRMDIFFAKVQSAMSSRTVSDFVIPEGGPVGPDFRRRLEWLILLRLLLTSLLLAATISIQLTQYDSFLVHPLIPLYCLIFTTFVLSLLYGLCLPKVPNLWGFSVFQIGVDLLYYTILIYFTGGASSLFSLIYVFPIIMAGIIHYRRGALVTASASAVLFGLLTNFEYYRVIPAAEWPWVSPWARGAQAYGLWVMVVNFTVFFLAAILSSSISEQLQRLRTSWEERETYVRKLSELHAGIVKSIPIGIITTDREDRITFVNASGSRLLDAPFSDLVGLPLEEVLPIIAFQSQSGGMTASTFTTMKEIAGRELHLEVILSELRGEDDLPTGRLIVFEDVTSLRKMEERVKSSEHQAALVRVAAGMAHEIRNPLAALRGAAELLGGARPAARDSDSKLLNIIIREADRLNGLLGDFLLAVSPRTRVKTRFMLSRLVEEVTDLFSKAPRIRDTVRFRMAVNKGVAIEGDPQRIKQALWNLLTNAADATEEARGRLVVVSLGVDETGRRAVLSVEDSGRGVLPEMRDRVFEPFASSKETGTGLGLPIARGIIEAHEGAIEISDSPRGGAVVEVRLPLAPERGADREVDS